MTDYNHYTDYAVEQAKKLLAIDSPSGYGRSVTEYLLISEAGTTKTGFFWKPTVTPWAAW